MREASDYYNEPLAARCFNCAYLQFDNLKFECSKFAVKTNAYTVCDDWLPCLERVGDNFRLFLTPNQEELRQKVELKAEVGEREPPFFLLVSKKKQ